MQANLEARKIAAARMHGEGRDWCGHPPWHGRLLDPPSVVAKGQTRDPSCSHACLRCWRSPNVWASRPALADKTSARRCAQASS
jgi:hypothetical protein